MIRLVLPMLPPSANRLWRVQSHGRGHKSSEYKRWLEETGWECLRQARGRKIHGSYSLRLSCVRPDRRRRDIDNLLKATNDLIKGIGIVADDSLCERLEAGWVTDGEPCVIELMTCISD